MSRTWLGIFNRHSQVFSKAALCIRHNCSRWQVQQRMLRMCLLDVLTTTQLMSDGPRTPNQVYGTSSPISQSARSQVVKATS